LPAQLQAVRIGTKHSKPTKHAPRPSKALPPLANETIDWSVRANEQKSLD
jgi:hypothetical protein